MLGGYKVFNIFSRQTDAPKKLQFSKKYDKAARISEPPRKLISKQS